jgi:hypothetical protein
MEHINIPASIKNTSPVSKLQHQQINAPLNNTLRNRDIQEEHDAHKAKKPNETDEAEGRQIDPDDRKKDKQNRRDKKNKKEQQRHENRGRDSGKFVDFSA